MTGFGCWEKEHRANYWIGEGPQGTRAALSQMQLQAMEWVEMQEKDLWRLSALLMECQAILKSLLERPHQETTKLHPRLTSLDVRPWITCLVPLMLMEGQHQEEVKSLTWVGHKLLKGTPLRTSSQMQRFCLLPKGGSALADMAMSTFIVLRRPTEHCEEQAPQTDASQVLNYAHGPLLHPE